jgi:hypothetical protein
MGRLQRRTLAERDQRPRLQHQIKEAVDLAQPDGCDVIYYQVGDEWRRFPAEVTVLKKRIRLSLDPANENLTNIWIEANLGSWAGGGGGFNWEYAANKRLQRNRR